MSRQIDTTHDPRRGDPAPHLTIWLADWPAVRSEIEHLLDQYLQSKPDYDRSRTERVVVALDRALAELAFDAGWLEGKLV